VEAAVGLADIAGERHGHVFGLAEGLAGEGRSRGDDEGEADHFVGLKKGVLAVVAVVVWAVEGEK